MYVRIWADLAHYLGNCSTKLKEGKCLCARWSSQRQGKLKCEKVFLFFIYLQDLSLIVASLNPLLATGRQAGCQSLPGISPSSTVVCDLNLPGRGGHLGQLSNKVRWSRKVFSTFLLTPGLH